MKKFIKIFFISLLSLLGVLIIAISILTWIVFTPERLTPVVRKQAAKYITCKSEIGSVELTFFSTFPNFGLKVRDFALINPSSGSMADTLVRVKELVAFVDAQAYWRKKDIILIGLEMNGGSVNVYSDSLGNTNYNILPPDTNPAPADTSEAELPFIDIKNIEVKDVSLNYNDMSLKLNALINNLSAKINGTISRDSISGNVKVSTSMLSFQYDGGKLNSVIRDLSAKIDGKVTQDNISGNVKVSNSLISLEYGGEKYLQQDAVQFNLPVDVVTSRRFITLKNASASINDMELWLNGTIENDTLRKNINTDLTYKLASWPVKNILALVPPSYKTYFNGIDVDGLLSSDGSIKGIYSASHMPLMDMHILFEKGTLKYSGFSLPLHDINGDLAIYTDLTSDSLSYVRINRFTAKTPQSTIRTGGMVTHLFKDISLSLSTDAGLTLDEFNSMIPDSMKTVISGKASGQLKSRFTMSQLEKMQIDKMKLSGTVSLTGFDVKYDSISLKTDRSEIVFSLPNNKPLTKTTGFVFASIISDNIEAGKLASYNASLKKSSILLETSDIRETTRIPDLICSFSMDSLSAGMGDMAIAIDSPFGKVSLSPRSANAEQPHINLSYKSGELRSTIGKNTATINKISTDLDIVNDNTQKDIFLQWLVKGYVDINQGLVTMSELTNNIELPTVKMDFDPETFSIRESRMKIGNSDFHLSGNLNNVLSYFRGDSILRGKFDFISDKTDIAQLMALTSGIGTYDSTSVNKYENTSVDTVSTGPYMVPKKMDVILNANIKLATLGVDTATNVKGAVQVHDGVLLLDGLTFDTPAARMQLTALYRTVRTNHLFLGIDYHMMNVEISELLTMIPDIDTIMPMLRSFGGKGEFHVAAETYLDSLYNIKKSTLRGAASIKGNNLVLMDGQTFSEIAKKLRFNKKTQNKVDTLSAEFTIFRNEIDVYPFLIVMDKYKAVVAGRHNLDMTFDYNISVVDCPLPVKLGVDVKGNEDDLSFKLGKCRYADYFRPTSRHAVESKQLELRKMIRDALAERMKE